MQTRLPQMLHSKGALRGHPSTSHRAQVDSEIVLLDAPAMTIGPVTVTDAQRERRGRR